MKIRVTMDEIKVVRRTYEVDGVNSIEMAKKCAERCYNHQFQPNTYMMREVPCRSRIQFDACEIVES